MTRLNDVIFPPCTLIVCFANTRNKQCITNIKIGDSLVIFFVLKSSNIIHALFDDDQQLDLS